MDVCKVQYVFFLNSGIQKKSLVPQQYLLPDLFKFMHFKTIIFSKYGKQRLKKIGNYKYINLFRVIENLKWWMITQNYFEKKT